jgi:DNA-directed RNA polymerase specialized sigma24 family protein
MTNDTYYISESTLDKVRSEYMTAFEQAKPRRLNFYVYLEQEHGIVNIVAEAYGSSWQYRTKFDNEKAATAFLLRA